MSVLSRELRDELEHFFERWRSRGIFQQDDNDLTLEEEFLLLISQYPEEALNGAVLMTAAETTGSSFSGRLPIHLACDNHAPVGVIRMLLDSDSQRTTILRPDRWGDLPIHTACSRSDFLEVIKLLLEMDTEKESIFIKDENGSLPLHMACRYNAGKEVIQLLLENDSRRLSLFEEGVYSQLPIHIACRGGASTEAIRVLLDFDEHKTSLLKEDNVGRLAIHLYLLTNRNFHRNMDTVRLLLEGMICNRLQRVGLDLWRQTMAGIYESLTKPYERDFVTRERLDAIGNELKALMRLSFLLELAVWKASCLRGSDNDGLKFHSMQDIDEWGKTEKHFDPCQYKQECHIKSGAEIIIPHVLPFLEDEPITRLMKELD